MCGFTFRVDADTRGTAVLFTGRRRTKNSLQEPRQYRPPRRSDRGNLDHQSSARPSPFASSVDAVPPWCPFGTNSCGWSNGARRYSTRSSVSASRNATSASISSEVERRNAERLDRRAVDLRHAATTLPPRL